MPKAFTVRIPLRPDSISALMAPVFCLAATEARLMPPRSSISTTRNTGMMAMTISAMRHSMLNITASAPTMVISEMVRSSGP